MIGLVDPRTPAVRINNSKMNFQINELYSMFMLIFEKVALESGGTGKRNTGLLIDSYS
jgi:hypothetical protein